MSTQDEIAARVDRFLGQIHSLVLQVARESVGEALSGFATGLLAARVLPVPSPAPRSAAKPAAAKPAAAKPAAAKPAAAKPPVPKPPVPKPPVPRPRATAPAQGPSAAEPAAPAPAAADAKREARVIDAVTALGSAKAGDIATHAHMPNGSTAVALRALVARGRLVRIETQRGAEYSVPAI